MFANARMYAINPAVASAWRALLEWVAARAEVDFEVIDYPAPAPLPALWTRPDAACMFMCGYPLSRAQPQPRVLAAPVPGPPGYAGRPVYWTDIVVPIESTITRLEQTLGRKFAYTTEDSQSGYQAPRLLYAHHAHGASLFASTVGPLVTPRRVVEAVLAGDADAGPLDSYVHDLLRLHEPELAGRLRVIATTPPTPIPPLVAAPGIAVARRRAHCRRPAGGWEERCIGGASERRCSSTVSLPQRPIDYRILRTNAQQADRLGYQRLS